MIRSACNDQHLINVIFGFDADHFTRQFFCVSLCRLFTNGVHVIDLSVTVIMGLLALASLVLLILFLKNDKR